MNVIEHCERCLDLEYAVIRSGDWEQLSGVLESKTAAMTHLRESGATASEVKALIPKLERNQHLLTASQTGIQAALTRLGQITHSLKQSQVYGPNGAIQDIAAPTGPTLEKRS